MNSAVVSKQSEYREVCYIERKFPGPFSNREFYVSRSLIYIPEKKGFLMLFRALNEERARNLEVEIPPETKKIVRGEMVKGFTFL